MNPFSMTYVIGLRRSAEYGAVRESSVKGLNLKGWEKFSI